MFMSKAASLVARNISGLLEFSVDPSDNMLVGLQPISETSAMYLGRVPLGGTTTGALRQFNLPTSRAPADWPEHCTYTVRY